MKLPPISPEERAKREAQDREEAANQARHYDVARGRLEGWSGGRVKPLIRDDQ